MQSIYYKEVVAKTEKYKRVLNILAASKEQNLLVPSVFNQDATGTKGILSTSGPSGMKAKPKNLDFIIERASEALLGPSKALLQSEATSYFENIGKTGTSQRIPQIINTFTNSSPLILTSYDEEGFYVTFSPLLEPNSLSAALIGTGADSFAPKYYLKADGSGLVKNIFVNDTLIEQGLQYPAYQLSQKMQNLLDTSSEAKILKNASKDDGSLTVSKSAILFYELVQKYYQDYFDFGTAMKLPPYFIDSKFNNPDRS